MKKEKRNKEKKATKKGWKIFKVILFILLVAILIGGGVFAYKMHKNGGGMKGFLATAVGHNEETLKNLPKLYCLVLGKSSQMELTDSIMLCSYDPKTQEASMLSIPRDTFIGKNKNRATSYDKINALYQSSPEKAMQAVSELTGIDVQYYLAIDSKGLIELVNAIGGVWYDVPMRMYYIDEGQNLYINLQAGYQKLLGGEAEQLLRFRHNWDGSTYPAEYGLEDIGRMRTQRNFIEATLKQTLKVGNIFKINQLIDIAQNNIETNLDFNTIKDYVPYAVEFSTENLKSGVLPGVSDKCNGVWIYLHDKKETQQMVQDLFLGQPEEEREGNTISTTIEGTTEKDSDVIKIELLNGSGEKEKLTQLTDQLEQAGYKISKAGNTSVTAKTTIMNRTGKSSSIENKIKELVGVGTVSSGSNNSGVDFTIIIGKDYKS